ncbi:MAG: hypothetical protein IKD05_03160 [Tidjanibacter sp.]|nr:hypothetical protein [Tidjanibacter sp.]MBR7129257.1 hypothetical protein [Tidjanibacter sp.]
MSKHYKSDYLWRAVVAVVYTTLCVLFFSPLDAPVKLAYPVGWLAVVSLCCGGASPLLVLALTLSAVGDVCGALGLLLPQIGAFGAAQVCYLVALARHCNLVGTPPKRIIGAAALPLTLLLIALTAIVPKVEGGVFVAAITLYALLIGTMVFLAGLHSKWVVRVGAVCFMLSDFVLAISLFVSPLPHVAYLPLYFIGQALLWWGLVGRAQKGTTKLQK